MLAILMHSTLCLHYCICDIYCTVMNTFRLCWEEVDVGMVVVGTFVLLYYQHPVFLKPYLQALVHVQHNVNIRALMI